MVMNMGFLLGMVMLWTSTAAKSLPGCPDHCGDLKVPYLADKFLVTCNQPFHPPKAFLRTPDLPLSNVSLDGELAVWESIARDCQNHSNAATVSLPPVAISDTDNKFTALGCDTKAVLINYSSCSGFCCCQTCIPAGLRNVTGSVPSFSSYNYSHNLGSYNANCRHAFAVEESKFKFSSSFGETLNGTEKVPMVINWAIGEESCDEAWICSNFSCRCLPGYQGNSYVTNGCKGICLVLSILLMGSFYGGIYWAVKKRNFLKSKEKFFEQNGGIMLRQLLSNLETAKIFTAEELKRATNNYDGNRVIGEGRYGKVYKGILPDSQQVAIKKSKIGDHTQTAQFINEVMFLLQINHRNVVQLLGCCLETEVPLLVYQFIPNGTLFHHIHKKGKAFVLPWKLRLKIASETAGALAYFHSATSTPTIHRDVKTSNILLDENYIAKVSDLGASKLIPIDQNQLITMVQGTLGYLDPEYFHTSQLTEKSDVYSFGVVLAELLTSKEVISFNRPEGERNLAMFFVSAVEKDCLLHVLDHGDIVDEENIEEVKKVANLAKMCLSVKGKERPTMKEVANELEGLINLDKHPWRKADL